MTFNISQQALLDRYPGKAIGDLPPEIRLEIANRQNDPDPAPVAPPVKETTAAAEYRGGRDIDGLDPVAREQYEWLNSDPIFRKPEAAAAVESASLDAPIDWRVAKLDTTGLHSEPPQTRIDVQNAFDRIRKVGPANVRETDLLMATKWLAR